MTTRAAKSSKPGPKPRGPFEDRRKTFTTRITEKTKAGLVEAARGADRSLSQEIELRLEQSLEQDEVFGGRQFRAMFQLFGSAAVLVEQKYGKSCFKDWKTWVAVQAAWKRLAVTFGPMVPKGYLNALLEAAKAQTGTGYSEPPPEDADLAVREAYAMELDKKLQAFFAFHRYQEDDSAQEAIGREMAVALLPDQRNPDLAIRDPSLSNLTQSAPRKRHTRKRITESKTA